MLKGEENDAGSFRGRPGDEAPKNHPGGDVGISASAKLGQDFVGANAFSHLLRQVEAGQKLEFGKNDVGTARGGLPDALLFTGSGGGGFDIHNVLDIELG